MPLENTPAAADTTAQASPGSPTSTAPANAGASPPPSSQPASQPSTPAGAPAGSQAPAPAETQAAQQASVRDMLRGLGVDPSSWQDDNAALQYLVGAARQVPQLQQLAQYGQVYVQHADQFQAWQRQQQEEAARKQQQSQAWWKAPEYDPSWVNKLVRDPQTGELRVVAGADPSIPQKYLAWQEHQRSFIDRFSQDPIAALKPGIEQVAREIAQGMVQQHLGGYREQTQAQQLLQGESGWIYQSDPNGNAVRDPNGRPVLSEYGQLYARNVQRAEQLGIRGVQEQHEYAKGQVVNAYLMAQYQGRQQTQTQTQQGEQAKAQFLANAAQHRPNAAGVAADGTQASPPPMRTSTDLAQVMLKQLQANGFQPNQPINSRL